MDRGHPEAAPVQDSGQRLDRASVMHRHLGAGHCPDLLREVGIAAAVSAICPHISRGLDAVLLEHPMHLAAGHAVMMHEGAGVHCLGPLARSEEHTSELTSLMRISYDVLCLKKKKPNTTTHQPYTH